MTNLNSGDRVKIDRIENGYWKGIRGVGTFLGRTPTGKARVEFQGKVRCYSVANLHKVRTA